jgi:hypothetical protein
MISGTKLKARELSKRESDRMGFSSIVIGGRREPEASVLFSDAGRCCRIAEARRSGFVLVELSRSSAHAGITVDAP